MKLMSLAKRIIILTSIFFVLSCANSSNQNNEFSQLLESKGSWVSHSTNSSGEIEIVYDERLKIKLYSDKAIYRVGEFHQEAASYIDIFEKNKPSYYCHHKYNFNKKRELLSVNVLFETCKYRV